ncbi:MAG: helix-turn-helix domain-containing protein [Deferribacteraceae bacterium]|nr:helix-turn-helix domain-containing protein [Deferribacteraceae bacterium]
MIGKKLKDLLKARDIEQIQLARAVGISPSRLANYLSDKREPDLDMLTRMAKFLGVDVNYFADMNAVTYHVTKEVIATDSAKTIDISIKQRKQIRED